MAATPTYVKTLALGNVGTTIQNAALTLTASMDRAGNSLVIFASATTTTADLTGITDSRGNAWTVEAVVTGTAQRAHLATCLNAARLLAGDTVTLSYAATGQARAIVLAEFDGLKQSGTPRDGAASASGAGTAGSSQAVASGALVTANPTDILLGLVVSNQANVDNLTAAGWSQLARQQTSPGSTVWPVYRVVGSAGSYDLAGTLSGGGAFTRAWIAAQWAFKAADLSAPQAAFVGAEVASVVGTGRSASLVAAEVAYAVAHAAASFVGAEVAYAAPAVTAQPTRIAPRVLVLG